MCFNAAMSERMQYHISSCLTEETDVEALAALMHESIHTLGAREYSTEQLNAWSPTPRTGQEAIERFARQRVFMAEDDLGLAAFMTLTSQGYLDFAYAHPRAAGKGAANAVYQALELFAQQKGLDQLTSDISRVARPFFEKRGWRVVKEQHPERNGEKLTNYKMEKTLKA